MYDLRVQELRHHDDDRHFEVVIVEEGDTKVKVIRAFENIESSSKSVKLVFRPCRCPNDIFRDVEGV